ncbi:MAG: HK97 gp10 family phage protein, partial [Synergistaceae bacterium]|nr:HK97 gp10 family phage protein [Synergistaceae bacterium]
MKISDDDLSTAMQKILSKYGNDVRDVVRRLVKKAGEEARDELKQTSPRR